MRHKHRHKHKHKHKTTSISYGRTKANSKENSFCFVFVNLTGKLILCYFAYAYVASENQALGLSRVFKYPVDFRAFSNEPVYSCVILAEQSNLLFVHKNYLL